MHQFEILHFFQRSGNDRERTTAAARAVANLDKTGSSRLVVMLVAIEVHGGDGPSALVVLLVFATTMVVVMVMWLAGGERDYGGGDGGGAGVRVAGYSCKTI
ncbi:hypothetical protein R6Q59_021590 [Mikania micrantha]